MTTRSLSYDLISSKPHYNQGDAIQGKSDKSKSNTFEEGTFLRQENVC